MGKKRRLLLAAIVVVALIVLAWLLLNPREPAYEGKSLTEWLQHYRDFNEDVTVSEQIWHRQANEAVCSMGTNAIPLLLELIDAKDSKFKLKVMAVAGKQSIFKFKFTTAEVRHQMGLGGFHALGPAACPAIPALGKMLADGQLNAARALGMIGPESISTLTNALTNTNPKVRVAVVMVLGRYAVAYSGPETKLSHADTLELRAAETQVRPALRRCTNDPDEETRYLAGKMLDICSEADSVPAKAGVK